MIWDPFYFNTLLSHHFCFIGGDDGRIGCGDYGDDDDGSIGCGDYGVVRPKKIPVVPVPD